MTLRNTGLLLFWATVCVWPGAADEIEDLFQSPPFDLVDAVPAPLPPVVTEPVRPFVQLNTWAAAASDLKTASLYYETSLSGGIDFRPDDALRVMASLKTSLPDGVNLSFSPPTISELFVDYTPVDLVSVRFGQFGLTWGQARLVNNAGNLVSSAGSGVTAKASVAVPQGGLVLVASAQGPLDSHKAPAQLLYAGSLEQTWGPLTLGVSGSQNSGRSLETVWRGAFFARTSWGGADWYLESMGTWLTSPIPRKAIATAGVLWQGGYPVWSVNGEYQYEREDDGLDNDGQTSIVAVSLDTKRLWSFTPKLLWAQDWEDRSGQLTSALVFELAPHLTVTLALPWVYGIPGSRYVVSNPDPEGRWWALGLKGALAWNY